VNNTEGKRHAALAPALQTGAAGSRRVQRPVVQPRAAPQGWDRVLRRGQGGYRAAIPQGSKAWRHPLWEQREMEEHERAVLQQSFSDGQVKLWQEMLPSASQPPRSSGATPRASLPPSSPQPTPSAPSSPAPEPSAPCPAQVRAQNPGEAQPSPVSPQDEALRGKSGQAEASCVDLTLKVPSPLPSSACCPRHTVLFTRRDGDRIPAASSERRGICSPARSTKPFLHPSPGARVGRDTAQGSSAALCEDHIGTHESSRAGVWQG